VPADGHQSSLFADRDGPGRTHLGERTVPEHTIDAQRLSTHTTTTSRLADTKWAAVDGRCQNRPSHDEHGVADRVWNADDPRFLGATHRIVRCPQSVVGRRRRQYFARYLPACRIRYENRS
jgi:hypothetical protein